MNKEGADMISRRAYGDRNRDESKHADRQGFSRVGMTFTEILVVCVIIGVLMTLLLGIGIPALMRMVHGMGVTQRMQAISTGLEAYRRENGAESLLRYAIGRDIQWRSLREVLERLRPTWKDLPMDGTNTTGRAQYWRCVPPGIKMYFDDKLVAHNGRIVALQGDPETNQLESWVFWLNRQTMVSTGSGWTPVANQRLAYDSASVPKADASGRMLYDTYGTSYGRGSLTAFTYVRTIPSRRMETLDDTLEILPPRPASYTDLLPATWYLAQWPALGAITRDGLPAAWPDPQAWDAELIPDQLVSTVPMLEWPFGMPALGRLNGLPVQPANDTKPIRPMSLESFSPMRTPDVLLCAGIIENKALWRRDRRTAAPWNDPWGNPLIVGLAAYVAPRLDLIDGIDATRDMPGARDFLFKKAAELYQRSYAIYVSYGAIGPLRSDQAPYAVAPGQAPPDWAGRRPLAQWAETVDHRVLRAGWKQILGVCAHSDPAKKLWDETWRTRPQWTGVRDVTNGDLRCLLNQVTEY